MIMIMTTISNYVVILIMISCYYIDLLTVQWVFMDIYVKTFIQHVKANKDMIKRNHTFPDIYYLHYTSYLPCGMWTGLKSK